MLHWRRVPDMKSWAVTCGRGPCFVPVLEEEHTFGELQDPRLLRGPEFYQSQKNLKDLSLSQARMKIKVSHLGWGRTGTRHVLVVNCLNVINCTAKVSACLNSSTPHFPVSSEQAHWKKKKNQCFLLTVTVLRAQTCRAGGGSQADA